MREGVIRKDVKHRSAIRETSEKIAPPSSPLTTLVSTPEKKVSATILRILSVLAVIGITFYVYSIRERVEEFARFGYFGAFLIALVANATVILPAPGVAVVFGMGGIINPLGVGLAAGAGGALGELTGYLAGYGGQAAVENKAIYNRTLPWVQKYGAWVILVLSAIPNPFFDVAGIAAGISKLPLWKFLLACWVGVTIKMLIFAYAGAYSIDWIAGFYK
jgi:membrane protein DedA with SNARE-associated domain